MSIRNLEAKRTTTMTTDPSFAAHTDPAEAGRAAVRNWLAIPDRAGLVPVVFSIANGQKFEPGVWPRARLEELPESDWVVHDRTI